MPKVYKIHPSIGIARVGTSDEFYIGSEIPGVLARPSDGRYRDNNRKLRRQAARFWIFEYDDSNPDIPTRQILVGEKDIAQIVWTVHLVNKKAIWFEFDERHGITGDHSQGSSYPPDWPLRNQSWIPRDQAEERKRRLVINPGPRQLMATGQTLEIEEGNSGGFNETWPGPLVGGKEIISLGTISTDDKGRLIVAGGYGKSGAKEPDAIPGDGRLRSFVNNDKWFDDVSDGFVRAEIVFSNGQRVDATPSWLIVGPPDYAPPIENIVTMYDVLYDLAIRELGLNNAIFDVTARQYQPNYRPSFTKELWPILRRPVGYRWVIDEAKSHVTKMGDMAVLAQASLPNEDPDNIRVQIFSRLRDPNNINGPIDRDMPRLHNDGTGGITPETLRLTVTHTQFELLRKWATGQFIADWPPGAQNEEITAEGLDRAALESISGGSFFPGIEAGWILRDKRIYLEPFRLRPATSEQDPNGVTPGDITKRSAVPWQADFLKCGRNWWPAQRPNQVRPRADSPGHSPWDEGINGHLDLVERWSLLGIVIPAEGPLSRAKFHESERELPRS